MNLHDWCSRQLITNYIIEQQPYSKGLQAVFNTHRQSNVVLDQTGPGTHLVQHVTTPVAVRTQTLPSLPGPLAGSSSFTGAITLPELEEMSQVAEGLNNTTPGPLQRILSTPPVTPEPSGQTHSVDLDVSAEMAVDSADTPKGWNLRNRKRKRSAHDGGSNIEDYEVHSIIDHRVDKVI